MPAADRAHRGLSDSMTKHPDALPRIFAQLAYAFLHERDTDCLDRLESGLVHALGDGQHHPRLHPHRP
jgi:hypothetical protein